MTADNRRSSACSVHADGHDIAGVLPVEHLILASILWAIATLAVFAPLSVVMFNRWINR